MDSHILREGTTKTQIIRRKNGMVLVQWNEEETFRQAWVTPQMIASDDGQNAWVHNPGAGIPRGVDWHRIFTFVATSKDVDRELKRVGIWTVEDLEANPNAALGAIKSALGLDLAALRNAAKKYEQQLEV